MAKVNQLIHLLEKLQSVSYVEAAAARRHDADADAALRLIFHIGREGLAFTPEQKRKLANNLVLAIKSLQINVEGHRFEYRKRLKSIILKKRSALQFLYDNYGEYPIEGQDQKLSALFAQVDLRQTIGILDSLILDHPEQSDSDDVHSDREFPGIPSSHTWWQ